MAVTMRSLKLIRNSGISSSADGMAGGQMLDLLADERGAGQALSQSETETMQNMKTGG